jgi:hypothetical protein
MCGPIKAEATAKNETTEKSTEKTIEKTNKNSTIEELTNKLKLKEFNQKMDNAYTELKKNISIRTVLKIPFGSKERQVGYENAPDYTPYPESAQSFVLKDSLLYILDTFNSRILVYEEKKNMLSPEMTGKLSYLKAIVPKVDVATAYYGGMGILLDNSIVLSDIINKALIKIDQAGDMTAYYSDIQEWDDITAIHPFISGDSEYIALGDKGYLLKNLIITDNTIKVKNVFSAPGLTEQGAFISYDKNGTPFINYIQQTDKGIILKTYNPLDPKTEKTEKEFYDLGFPIGSVKCAGVDSKGNIYLYWAGLKDYIPEESKNIFNILTETMDSTQILAYFKIFDPSGKELSDFTLPFSSAAEGAGIYDDILYIMDYNAQKAPAGNFSIRAVKFK